MSNKSKQKGTAFETLVTLFFRGAGWPVERRTLSGRYDKGDLSGIPDWTLELKAEKAISLSEYMKEAEVEAGNAGTPFFAAIVKRRNKGVEDAYVVMPLRIFNRVLKELNT